MQLLMRIAMRLVELAWLGYLELCRSGAGKERRKEKYFIQAVLKKR